MSDRILDRPRRTTGSRGAAATVVLAVLLAFVVLIGFLPGWLLDMIQTGSAFASFHPSVGQ